MIVVNSRFLTQRITGVQRFSIELSLQIKKKLGCQVLFVSPPDILHTLIPQHYYKYNFLST